MSERSKPNGEKQTAEQVKKSWIVMNASPSSERVTKTEK